MFTYLYNGTFHPPLIAEEQEKGRRGQTSTSLMWLEEAIQIRVVIEEKKLMDSNETRYHVKSHDFYLESFVHSFNMFKQLFSKTWKHYKFNIKEAVRILIFEISCEITLWVTN